MCCAQQKLFTTSGATRKEMSGNAILLYYGSYFHIELRSSIQMEAVNCRAGISLCNPKYAVVCTKSLEMCALRNHSNENSKCRAYMGREINSTTFTRFEYFPEVALPCGRQPQNINMYIETSAGQLKITTAQISTTQIGTWRGLRLRVQV